MKHYYVKGSESCEEKIKDFLKEQGASIDHIRLFPIHDFNHIFYVDDCKRIQLASIDSFIGKLIITHPDWEELKFNSEPIYKFNIGDYVSYAQGLSDFYTILNRKIVKGKPYYCLTIGSWNGYVPESDLYAYEFPTEFKKGDKVKIKTTGKVGFVHDIKAGFDHWIYIIECNREIFHVNEKNVCSADENNRCPFKPFDKVLMRESYSNWNPHLFGRMFNDEIYEDINGACYSKCIPYEGNEHLVYTKNSPE